MPAVQEAALPRYRHKFGVSADQILFFDTDPVDFQRGKTGSIDQETALKREKFYMASRVLPSSQSFADISDFDMIHSGQPMTQGGFTDTGLSCDTDGMPLEYLMDLIFRKHRLHGRFHDTESGLLVLAFKRICLFPGKICFSKPYDGTNIEFGT